MARLEVKITSAESSIKDFPVNLVPAGIRIGSTSVAPDSKALMVILEVDADIPDGI